MKNKNEIIDEQKKIISEVNSHLVKKSDQLENQAKEIENLRQKIKDSFDRESVEQIKIQLNENFELEIIAVKKEY